MYKPKRPTTYTCTTEVRPSTIPGAGMGLFLTEPARKGERLARYSGDPLTAAEAARSQSRYLLKVNRNLVLDASSPTHMCARYINDGPHSARPSNARFAKGHRAYKDKQTGRLCVSVFASKSINAGSGSNAVEIFTYYGRSYKWPIIVRIPISNYRIVREFKHVYHL